MYAHNDTGGEDRVLYQGCNGASGKTQTPGGFDAFPVPQNERDSSQQVALRYGRIGGGHRIPTGDQFRIVRLAPGDDAVNKKSPVPAEENDVALGHGVTLDPLNEKRISGHDCGQHTPPGHPQAQAARRAQYLARKFALEGVQVGWSGLRKTFHDALVRLVEMHWPSVVVFPHESALVTNTRS